MTLKRLLGSTLALALLVGACGDDGDVAETTTATQAPATTQAPTTVAPTTVADGGIGSDGSGLRVGVIFDGPLLDGGWNESHSAAVDRVQDAYPGIEITRIEGANPGQRAQLALEELASQGHQLILATGSSHTEDILTINEDYPDSKFATVGGTTLADNLAQYFTAIEEIRYLHGIMAGMLTETGVVGFISGFPIPIEVRTLNAVALGVEAVNPDARMEVLWVNSWYDPDLEREAARTLFEAGVDVIVSDMSSPGIPSFADREGVLFSSYDQDLSEVNPQSWMGGFHIRWDAYYRKAVEDMIAGAWQPELYYGGIAEGMLVEATYGPAITQDILDVLEEKKAELVSGSFEVFRGPIVDNEGVERVPAGESMGLVEVQACCDWLVSFLEGASITT